MTTHPDWLLRLIESGEPFDLIVLRAWPCATFDVRSQTRWKAAVTDRPFFMREQSAAIIKCEAICDPDGQWRWEARL